MDGITDEFVRVCGMCGGQNILGQSSARVTICARCDAVLDEAAPSDLVEFHAFTQTEEVHCVVVAPDVPSHLEPEPTTQASRQGINIRDEDLRIASDATQDAQNVNGRKGGCEGGGCEGECTQLEAPWSHQQDQGGGTHQPHPELDPDDPYMTPGFITAFRMLAPLREAVYGVSARTMHGALADMERVLGDVIYSEYSGDNIEQAVGAQDSGLTALATPVAATIGLEDVGDRAKVSLRSSSSSLARASLLQELACQPPSQHILSPTCVDTRNALVAYFQILDIANILDIDQETANVANRIFRYVFTVSASLRSRSVEVLAAACLCAASERRTRDHHQWVETISRTELHHAESTSILTDQAGPRSNAVFEEGVPRFGLGSLPPRPSPLSIDDVAGAADLDAIEVERYLKHVKIAIGAVAPDSAAAVAGQIPVFCNALGGDEQLTTLAAAIAENAFASKLCPRRNAQSICSAAIYMACNYCDLHRTQAEIARITKVTEVTLRKVHKELTAHLDRVIPDWFQPSCSWVTRTGQGRRSRPAIRVDRSESYRQRPFAPAVRKSSRASDRVNSEFYGGVKVEETEHNSRDRRTGLKCGEHCSPQQRGRVSDLDRAQSECPSRARRDFETRSEETAAGTNSSDANASGREHEQQKLLVALMQHPEMLLTVAGAVGMIPKLMVPPPPPPPLPEHDNLECSIASTGLPWPNGCISTSAINGTLRRTQSPPSPVAIGDEADKREQRED